MAEIAPGGGNGKSNRTFLFIVGGLVSLLILGLIGVAAILFLPSLFGAKAATVAQLPPTATATRVVINTPTSVPSPTMVPPTDTPTATPAPSATPTVIGAFGMGAPGSVAGAAAGGDANTANGQKGGGELPDAGLGEDLLLLVGGLALAAVVIMTRRARLSV